MFQTTIHVVHYILLILCLQRICRNYYSETNYPIRCKRITLKPRWFSRSEAIKSPICTVSIYIHFRITFKLYQHSRENGNGIWKYLMQRIKYFHRR